MKKFEVGAMYWDTSAVDHNDVMVIKITRRTEKSVWFVRMRGDQPEGEPSRTKIFTNATYEYIMPYRYSMAPVWDADRKVEPEADDQSAPETETANAAERAAQDSAEPEAAAEAETTKGAATEIIKSEPIGNGRVIRLVRGDNGYSIETVEPSGGGAFQVGWELTLKSALKAFDEYVPAYRTPDATAEDDSAAANVPDADEKARNVFAYVCDAINAANGDADKLNALRIIADSIARNVRLSPELRHIEDYIAYAFRNEEEVPEAFDLYYNRGTEETAYHFGWADFTPATPVNQTESDSAEAGRPAPHGGAAEANAAPSVCSTRNPVAPYDIFRYHPESGTYLFENEGEASLIDALNFHADSGNALSVVNALYEITHDGGGWFSPRNHPVMLDALNSYIEFLAAEIEVFDNFPNEREKEIAAGKLAEAKVIRDAFAADVARAAA